MSTESAGIQDLDIEPATQQKSTSKNQRMASKNSEQHTKIKRVKIDDDLNQTSPNAPKNYQESPLIPLIKG